MRALITFGADHPQRSYDILEEASRGDLGGIDKDTLVAMIQESSDVAVIEVELLD